MREDERFYDIDYDDEPIVVVVTVEPAEPDVGAFGNGRVSIGIEAIYRRADSILVDIEDEFDEGQVENISHKIYDEYFNGDT
tara:strand:- start:339 stop:584 length:246 start_codon:yes stop_codon:yes gene_type:complete